MRIERFRREAHARDRTLSPPWLLYPSLPLVGP
jgi:hypothetical protein